eukprot:4206525-Prymnesium_polylepis.1
MYVVRCAAVLCARPIYARARRPGRSPQRGRSERAAAARSGPPCARRQTSGGAAARRRDGGRLGRRAARAAPREKRGRASS